MIRLSVRRGDGAAEPLAWERPVLRVGRAGDNDLVFPVDKVSGHHGKISLEADGYVYRDLGSTNGSLVQRHGQQHVLDETHPEMVLAEGDQIYLATQANQIVVEEITLSVAGEEDALNRTILAEAQTAPAELETSLGEDYVALRSAVRLARELVGLEALPEIARLTCEACLRAFPAARRALYLAAEGDQFRIECTRARTEDSDSLTSTILNARPLLERCLKERKGFLFLFERDKMQAIGTMAISVEAMAANMAQQTDRIILCCPLIHQDRCFGFIEMDAPLTAGEHHALSRRDLSLGTLMAHLVAARLHDLENQAARISLARKATAGYLSATVGHCFKNLLFVPMSLARLLPLCIEQGRWDEARYMLARNSINIRYLDILSNEFAAASKDPSEGFGPCDVGKLLGEVADLVGQVDAEKVEVRVDRPEGMPKLILHAAALHRTLMNLTLNAVDALLALQREEKGWIEIKAAYDPARAALAIGVRDNGPGIPENILENLRAIYGQVQQSADALGELQSIAERVRSTKDQGFKEHYGLGFLFVCQTVQQHKGHMKIEAAPGKGTTFLLSLPAPVSEGVEVGSTVPD